MSHLTSVTDALSRTTNYEYNTASQITQIAELSQTRNFNYDSVDRLTSVQNPTQTVESYTYDAVGNRTASHISSTYSYQPFNKVITIGSSSYSYDNNGDLTQKIDFSGTWNYTWDYENRLKQVTRPDSTVISYKYDALGRRIQRNKGNDWTKFVYDGQDVVKDINSDNSTVDYLNGLGIDDKIRQSSSSGTLYFSKDHLGSTYALTNASGSVVESVSYDSSGNGASSLTRYGYTGREWDLDAQLYYYRNRWYDPQDGRFISADPIGLAGGINSYAYVGNNSINSVDPSGLQQVGFSANPGNFPPAPAPARPMYPDNYNWNGAFWSDLGNRCKDILKSWKAIYFDQLADPIKYLLSQPDVQFALISMGMPYGTPYGELGAGAGETVVATKTVGTQEAEVAAETNTGTLTNSEQQALQDIADKYQTDIDVVGSRGAGNGRNIDTDLPFGKGPGTRSDIDIRIDGQLEIDTKGAINSEIRNRLPGAEVRTRYPGGSLPPYIRITPRGKP